MPRTPGAKNKPKDIPRRYELLDDILTIREVAYWWKTDPVNVRKEIEDGTIPPDCYWKIGREIKIIKYKVAVLKGIIPAA